MQKEGPDGKSKAISPRKLSISSPMNINGVAITPREKSRAKEHQQKQQLLARSSSSSPRSGFLAKLTKVKSLGGKGGPKTETKARTLSSASPSISKKKPQLIERSPTLPRSYTACGATIKPKSVSLADDGDPEEVSIQDNFRSTPQN